jgi:hypothetical protein
MRIALCSTFVPFASPDDRVEGLRQALLAAGHQVEHVRLPWSDDPAVAFRQLAACRWIDLQSSADCVICVGPPAHAIPHTWKVIWLAADAFSRAFAPGDSAPLPARGLRAASEEAHGAALREGRRVFATSDAAAECLGRLTGVRCQVLEADAHWHSTLDRLLS